VSNGCKQRLWIGDFGVILGEGDAGSGDQQRSKYSDSGEASAHKVIYSPVLVYD
jgi:hypothetical protein